MLSLPLRAPRFAPCFVLACSLLGLLARAQELPPLQERVAVPILGPDRDATAQPYCVQLPAGHRDEAWVPLLLLWPHGAGDLAAAQALLRDVGSEAARAGFVVVAPFAGAGAKGSTIERHRALFAELRRSFRIAQGGMHAAAAGDIAGAVAAVLAQRHQFQTFTALAPARDEELAGLRRQPARRVVVLPAAAAADAAARGRHWQELFAARALAGPAGDVACTLDDFHDAAANGDEARYFAILPDDAVFLGTDASERWTGAAFRAFALPYFQRGEAWTYVPLQRHVTLAPGGELAWFDELLDNEGYGTCRGSGVLVRRAGRWVLQHYDLTIPIPNDLAAAFAARIRSFTDGLPPTATTVVFVRHAEKADQSKDPELSMAGAQRAEALVRTLRDVPIDAVWHTEYRRTAATVAPLCAARGLTANVLPAADLAGLARTLRQLPPGQTVVVCGHSNTIPELIELLGGTRPVIADDRFDGLYVLTRTADAMRLLTLGYGP